MNVRIASKARLASYNGVPLTSVANDTKWEELRLTMASLDPEPEFVREDVSGERWQPDRMWLYHFSGPNYASLRFVEIKADDTAHREDIRKQLQTIGLAGETTDEGFRVYGYTLPGEHVSRF
jgi:hypothetical protein